MCDSADEQQTQLQMPHALGLVLGRFDSLIVCGRKLFIISMKLYVA